MDGESPGVDLEFKLTQEPTNGRNFKKILQKFGQCFMKITSKFFFFHFYKMTCKSTIIQNQSQTNIK